MKLFSSMKILLKGQGRQNKDPNLCVFEFYVELEVCDSFWADEKPVQKLYLVWIRWGILFIAL